MRCYFSLRVERLRGRVVIAVVVVVVVFVVVVAVSSLPCIVWSQVICWWPTLTCVDCAGS